MHPCFVQGMECLISKFKSVDTLSYKTVSANRATVTKDWVHVDADGPDFGTSLFGSGKNCYGAKNKTNFTPHVDCGDNVIITNASKNQFDR